MHSTKPEGTNRQLYQRLLKISNSCVLLASERLHFHWCYELQVIWAQQIAGGVVGEIGLSLMDCTVVGMGDRNVYEFVKRI